MSKPKSLNYYDYIIVGSGIAGLYTALLAKEHGSVLILTKGSISDTNTRHAQGGIAAPIGQGDSPELHLQDTLVAGAGLCDLEAVRILVEEQPTVSPNLSTSEHYSIPLTVRLPLPGSRSHRAAYFTHRR